MLAFVITLAVALCALGAPPMHCIALVAVFQLQEFAMSRRRAVCFAPVLTPEQVKEFEGIVGEVSAGWAKIKDLPNSIAGFDTRFKAVEDGMVKLQAEAAKYKKLMLAREDGGVKWINGVPFVSDGCAKALAGQFIACCYRQDRWPKQFSGEDTQARMLGLACEYLAVEKTALTSSDIPLPTIYMPQVIELVYAYGQFRQYSTVFPLGAGTVNLPQLKTGEDDFTFYNASGAITEKKVSAQNVTFTAKKCGGIVRIPTEIEEDTFIALGQFIARYISRRFAALEDKCGFIGDGSATYGTITGVGPYCLANPTYLIKLANGKTASDDSTIKDWRAIRAKVNPQVLRSGRGAYYCNSTCEGLLTSFNTIGQPLVYIPSMNGADAKLDGFPVRFTGVHPAHNPGVANAAAVLTNFGDLSYWYLGERGQPRVETSREVYFASDEIGMRALERIDIQPLAPDAMSALQLGN